MNLDAQTRALRAASEAGAIIGVWRHGGFRRALLRVGWPRLADRLDRLDDTIGRKPAGEQ